MSPELRLYTQPEDTFSIGKDAIGGPKDHWTQSPTNKTTWEFTNQVRPDGSFKGYEFKFPKRSAANIWIDVDGKEEKYTLNGGEGARLDSAWRVTKIELTINPRSWRPEHEGQWEQWEDNGLGYEPGTTWKPIRQTPSPKRVTPVVRPPVIVEPEKTPIKEKYNYKRLLKWALAGILAVGGIGTAVSIMNQRPYEEINLHADQSLEIDNAAQEIILVKPGNSVYLGNGTEMLQVNVQPGNGLIIISTIPLLKVGSLKGNQDDIIVQDKIQGEGYQVQDNDRAQMNSIGNIHTYWFYLSDGKGNLNDNTGQGEFLKDLCNIGPGISCGLLT